MPRASERSAPQTEQHRGEQVSFLPAQENMQRQRQAKKGMCPAYLFEATIAGDEGNLFLEPAADGELAVDPKAAPKRRMLCQELIGRHELGVGPGSMVRPYVHNVTFDLPRIELAKGILQCLP